MTKKLEELLNINSQDVISPSLAKSVPVVKLKDQLAEFDNISSDLPMLSGLKDMNEGDLDNLASKAEQAYEDLMDLGMNVEARYGARMFEVAASMMNAAITAKSAKLDKKIKMMELQLKKLTLDKRQNKTVEQPQAEAEGYILMDRNSILEKLKNMDK